ncbi:MAG: bifunctional hydroxymethylpyrimidine kinase/phosphomethylpyrimidine kinase [Pseudomonadota bacterium]
MTKKTPIALTIAGSDSGGGAGIQADLKAISAQAVFGASALTAITAQNTVAVTAVHEIPADIVAAQIDAVLSDLDVGAIKLGMLFSPAIIGAVAQSLKGFTGALVVDPVMIAKSGDALLQDHAIEALKSEILPLATLLTPNLPEAARLLDQDVATNDAEKVAQAQALQAMGPKAVLLKDGHGTDASCTDILLTADGSVSRFEAKRIDTKNTHGTGCTYSATIAANLAKGMALPDAVRAAHGYLHRAIAQADTLAIGQGHGPVHHFHAMWP